MYQKQPESARLPTSLSQFPASSGQETGGEHLLREAWLGAHQTPLYYSCIYSAIPVGAELQMKLQGHNGDPD